MFFKYDEKKNREQMDKINAFGNKVEHVLIRYLPKYDELDSYILLLVIISLLVFSSFARETIFYIVFMGIEFILGFILIVYYLVKGGYYAFKLNETIPYKQQSSIANANILLIVILTLFAFFYSYLNNEISNEKNIFLTILISYNFIKAIFNAIVIYAIEDNNLIRKIYFSANNAKLIQIVIATILIPVLTYMRKESVDSFETLVIAAFSVYSITSLVTHLFNKQKLSTFFIAL